MRGSFRRHEAHWRLPGIIPGPRDLSSPLLCSRGSEPRSGRTERSESDKAPRTGPFAPLRFTGGPQEEPSTRTQKKQPAARAVPETQREIYGEHRDGRVSADALWRTDGVSVGRKIRYEPFLWRVIMPVSSQRHVHTHTCISVPSPPLWPVCSWSNWLCVPLGLSVIVLLSTNIHHKVLGEKCDVFYSTLY